jgi:hypothetical protein
VTFAKVLSGKQPPPSIPRVLYYHLRIAAICQHVSLTNVWNGGSCHHAMAVLGRVQVELLNEAVLPAMHVVAQDDLESACLLRWQPMLLSPGTQSC